MRNLRRFVARIFAPYQDRACRTGAATSRQGERGAARDGGAERGADAAEKWKLVKDTRFGVDRIYEVAKRLAEKAA